MGPPVCCVSDIYVTGIYSQCCVTQAVLQVSAWLMKETSLENCKYIQEEDDEIGVCMEVQVQLGLRWITRGLYCSLTLTECKLL